MVIVNQNQVTPDAHEKVNLVAAALYVSFPLGYATIKKAKGNYPANCLNNKNNGDSSIDALQLLSNNALGVIHRILQNKHNHAQANHGVDGVFKPVIQCPSPADDFSLAFFYADNALNYLVFPQSVLVFIEPLNY